MAKFKVGDKVRVKQWLEMPQSIQDSWGALTRCVGEVSTVIKLDGNFQGINLYELSDITDGDGFCCNLTVLEPEIELIIKKGEQLVFDFMKE